MMMRDEGMLIFYTLTNTADPGRMPVEKLVWAGSAYYGKRIVGVTRYYAAVGANKDFDIVVRAFNTLSVPDGAQYVILEDGLQYRIDFVQEQIELDAVDLTLVRLEDFYDVASE